MPLSVRVLVPVWGAAYVQRFAALALPSLLAPGNLPALRECCDLEVLFLTTRETEPAFEAEPAFRALRSLAPVRFVPIDDLVVRGCYGVTLTLAYTRGIGSLGAAMVDTCFVFLNADFVLADGALRALAARLERGERCIMAPSFRCIAEEVEPLLEARVDAARHALAMAPREMVRLALDHLHPTTWGKTVNQEEFSCSHPNQLYWSVDESTMLGRFYLIFMLCLRPQRELYTINSYCDYGFVPEFCPSERVTVIQDSDEFFMLECQGRQQEIEQLRFGKPQRAYIAQHLSEWTTRGHRHSAGHDLVFHAGELPAGLGAARRDAQRWYEALGHAIEPPKDHAFHDYWVGGVIAWLNAGGGAGAQRLPELAPGSHIFRERRGAVSSSGTWLGSMRALRWLPLHYHWLDERFLGRVAPRAGTRTLLTADAPPAGGWFAALAATEGTSVCSHAQLLDGAAGQAGYDRVVCVLTQGTVPHAQRLLPEALRLVKPDGEIALVYSNARLDAFGVNFSDQAMRMLTAMPPQCIRRARAAFLGGRLRQRLRGVLRRVDRFSSSRGAAAAIATAPLVAAALLGTLALNLWYFVRMAYPGSLNGACTSAVIFLRKP